MRIILFIGLFSITMAIKAVQVLTPPSDFSLKRQTTLQRISNLGAGALKGSIGVIVGWGACRWIEHSINATVKSIASLHQHYHRTYNNYQQSSGIHSAEAATFALGNTTFTKAPLELIKPAVLLVLGVGLGYVSFKFLQSAYSSILPALDLDRQPAEEILIIEPEQLNCPILREELA